MKEFLDKNWEDIITYLPNLLWAVGALAAGHFLIRFFIFLLKKGLKRSRLDASLHHFIAVSAKLVLRVFLFLLLLDILKIPTGPFITALGAAGLAISLAIKDNVASLVGGMLILFSKPFVAGDMIETEDMLGIVDYIELLHTRLHTVDNKVIHIPNHLLSTAKITNYSTESLRRLDLSFDVDYGEDFRRVEAIITRVTAAHPKVLTQPEPIIRLDGLQGRAMRIIARIWVKKEDYLDVHFDLHAQIKSAFDQEHIDAPRPGWEMPPQV